MGDTYGNISRRRFDDERLAFLEPHDIGVLDQVWCIALDTGEAIWEGTMPTDIVAPAEALTPTKVCRELPRSYTQDMVAESLQRLEDLGVIQRDDLHQLRVHALGRHNKSRIRERERKRTSRQRAAPPPPKPGSPATPKAPKKKGKPPPWRIWADKARAWVKQERGVSIQVDGRMHAKITAALKDMGSDELTRRYARYVKSSKPTLAKYAPAIRPFFLFGLMDDPDVMGIKNGGGEAPRPHTKQDHNNAVLDRFGKEHDGERG